MSLNFKAGDMTIHRVIEEETTFRPALTFLAGLTAERLAENRMWLQQAKALDAADVLMICFQSYVVRTPHHTILIDTCIGNDKPRPQFPNWHLRKSDVYMQALAAQGLSVNDIDYVMCTHLHVDHVGWNTRLIDGRWVPTFPKARYVFAKQEYDYWAELRTKADNAVFDDSVLPIVEAGRAELVTNDHQIGDHVRLLPTPGHTPGHVAFCFGKGRDDAVMSGDLMHSPLQTRYPEISAAPDVDKVQSAKTRRSFLERYCDSSTLCCTAHFPSPSAGRIQRWDDGFKCEMAAN
jgi:glyoxylase-like metal-dependent hydrolase (beta-lactamase superfamily II)